MPMHACTAGQRRAAMTATRGRARNRWRLTALGLAAAALTAGSAAAAAAPASAAPQTHPGGFNTKGDILIADQFNNRVIEVNSHHRVVWQFGNGSNVAGPPSLEGTNDAARVGSLPLIAGTGTPPGADPSCTKPAGCPDNRVILVNQAGHIVWQYGKAGVTGSGPDQLNTPVQNTYLPNGDILITDQGNQRVIQVNRAHQIVWQYGKTGAAGSGFNRLNNPNSAEFLANGHILIADENNNRVIEVTRRNRIVWQYGSPANTRILNGAAFASPLPHAHTLLPDPNHNLTLPLPHAVQDQCH